MFPIPAPTRAGRSGFARRISGSSLQNYKLRSFLHDDQPCADGLIPSAKANDLGRLKGIESRSKWTDGVKGLLVGWGQSDPTATRLVPVKLAQSGDGRESGEPKTLGGLNAIHLRLLALALLVTLCRILHTDSKARISPMPQVARLCACLATAVSGGRRRSLLSAPRTWPH